MVDHIKSQFHSTENYPDSFPSSKISVANDDFPNEQSSNDVCQTPTISDNQQTSSQKSDGRSIDRTVTGSADDVASDVFLDCDHYSEPTIEFNIQLHNHPSKSVSVSMVDSQLVQEMLQLLLERSETCHETCVCLYDRHTMQRVDNFAEVKSISRELVLVEDQYNVRLARQHIIRFIDLCSNQQGEEFFDGFSGSSPSAVYYICNRRSDKLNLPPSYMLPNSKEPIQLMDLMDFSQFIECEKFLLYNSISFGPWNPPISTRKLAGDHLYLRIVTLEGRVLHITSCATGFFVNQSTDDHFDFRQPKRNAIYHSLIDLMQAYSSTFKRKWPIVLDNRASSHPLTKLPCSEPVFSWIRPRAPQATPDTFRSWMYCCQETMGLGEIASVSPIGQLRDWNEEIQLTRQAFGKPLNKETLTAHRSAFRIDCDFALSTVRTAKAIMDGHIPPVNQSEHFNYQMFIWNNLFLSTAVDVRDHYLEQGGDIAAHYAAIADLRGIERFVNLVTSTISTSTPESGDGSAEDPSCLNVVGAVVIDYMGFRIAAQSIVPGILEKEQDQSVKYGSTDFGRTFLPNEQFNRLIRKCASKLHLKPHRIKTRRVNKIIDPSTIVNFPNYSSSDSGFTNDDISSSDSITTTNAISNNSIERNPNHASAKSMAASDECVFDHEDTNSQDSGPQNSNPSELSNVDRRDNAGDDDILEIVFPIEVKGIIGNDNRYYLLDMIGLTPPDLNFLPLPSSSSSSQERLVSEATPKSFHYPHKITRLRAELLDLYYNKPTDESETKETSSFIANICLPSVSAITEVATTDQHSNQIDSSINELRKLCQQITDDAIPNILMKEIEEEHPLDGEHLVEIMHRCGINVRYLSHIVNYCQRGNPAHKYVASLAISEIICRSAKHIFREDSRAILKPSNVKCDKGEFNSKIPSISYNSFIAQFLNCFVNGQPGLGASSNCSVTSLSRELNGSQENKKGNVGNSSGSTSHMNGQKWRKPAPRSTNNTTPTSVQFNSKSLWNRIKLDAKMFYNYDISPDNDENTSDGSTEIKVLNQFNMAALVRRLCRMCGIQICLFDDTDKSGSFLSEAGFADPSKMFTQSRIVDLFPVVKRAKIPYPKELKTTLEDARNQLKESNLQSAYVNANLAYSAAVNLYGPIHEAVAESMRTLAKINFTCNDASGAFSLQQRATLVSERLRGIDSSFASYDYFTLAHYCFMATVDSDCQLATDLMLRSRLLACISSPLSGNLLLSHPRLTKIDANMAIMLCTAGAYEHALYYSKSLLDRLSSDEVIANANLDKALFYHINTQVYTCMGDVEKAVAFERKSLSIFKQELGGENLRTLQSHGLVRQLTEQLVSLKRQQQETKLDMPSLSALFAHQSPPPKSSVLELLNTINGLHCVGAFLAGTKEGIEKLLERLFAISMNGGKNDSSSVGFVELN